MVIVRISEMRTKLAPRNCKDVKFYLVIDVWKRAILLGQSSRDRNTTMLRSENLYRPFQIPAIWWLLTIRWN